MDEILQKLIDNDLLSESTRAELSEQVKASMAAFKQNVREEVQTEVRAELAESWVTEREQLVAKLDGFLSEALTNELKELHEDVERFRDHETQQAGKIVEMRKTVATQVAGEMDKLVDSLDTFLEQRLTAELAELREDIEIARENDLGRKIFEAYAATYAKSFVDEKSVQAQLNLAESRLAAANKKLKTVEADKASVVRESKMSSVLSTLTGSAKEQMSFILKNVPTEKLEESYKTFLPRVLRESAEKPQAVVTTPIVESTAAKTQTALKTGDKAPVTEAVSQTAKPQLSESILLQQRMAGIIK